MQENYKPGKDERRANILQIARDIFMREGYAATSMSKIAAMVGGSKATLYSYFPSKKDLFFAVVDTESARLFEELYSIDDTFRDVRVALATFLRRFMTLVLSEECSAFDRIDIAESKRFPEIGQAAYEFGYKRGLERMEMLMRLGMDAGILRRANPRIAAEYLLNLCSGHLHKLRQWNIVAAISSTELESQIALATAAFLALFGNDELAAEARQFTGL